MAGQTSSRLLYSNQELDLAVRLFLLLVTLLATGCSKWSPVKNAPTYCRDIAPVLNANCVTCHRPGEVAPFSLLTYKDVRKRGKTIAMVTQRRIMPPWKPVPGYGDFVGTRRLTDEQISLIQKWVTAGMPEGDRKDLPTPPKFASGWRLGPPDITVTMPAAFEVPAEGVDIYRNFVIPLEIPEGKYIRALELRPTNRRVVHHAVLSRDQTGTARRKDEADTGPGFTEVLITGHMLPGNLGTWVPGFEPVPLPEDLSLPWPKNTDLVLQEHFHPIGRPETEQSTIGIYLTDQPPSKTIVDVVLEQKSLDIPPGEKAYRSHDSLLLPVDVDVVGLFPHMHRLGKEIKLTARLPSGEEKILIWIKDWNFNWQMHYQILHPVRLPALTELMLDAVHDNSAENPNNSSAPPKRVFRGTQTEDEMSLAGIQLMLINNSDLPRFRPLGRKVFSAVPAERDR
jgi:hypothetical protein